MVAARIQFVQGVTTGPIGEALIGTMGAFTANAAGLVGNPTWFEFTVIDVPPGSSQPIGLVAAGPQPSVDLLADARGGVLVKLRAQDGAGNVAEDVRAFQVLEASGRLIPPFLARAEALNFSDQQRGWAKYMEEWLHYVDSIGGAGAYAYHYVTGSYFVGETTGRVHVACNSVAPISITAGAVVDGFTLEVSDCTGAAGRSNGPITCPGGNIVDKPGDRIILVWNATPGVWSVQ